MSIFEGGSALGSILDPIAAKFANPFNTKLSKGGLRGNDFPAGFEIAEIIDGVVQDGTGGAGSQNTAISLIGNMMPMQPFPWGGEQRITRDYYPGNPEVAVQVLGPKENDLVIHGRFKDKHFKDQSYYGAAYQFALAVDGIRKRGNLVRFGMHGTAGKWIRYGFLEKVDFKMNKLTWIDYELTFLVVGETQPRNNFFASPDKTSPEAVNQNLINAVAAFQSSYSTAPDSVPRSLADKLNSLISDVAQEVNAVTNFVGTVISTAQSVAASAHRALGLIKNARSTISSMTRQIDSLKHTFDSHSVQGSSAGKASDTYKTIVHINNARAASAGLASFLAQLQAQFALISKTVPKARYKIVQGDTLQKIAMKFYGASDNWKAIYDHNLLQTTVLNVGTVLEIPKV